MPRLVSIDEDADGKLIFGLALADDESRDVLAKQISEEGVSWDDVEPESAVLAIRLQLYIESEDPPPMEVRIIDEDDAEGENNDDDKDPERREAKRPRMELGGLAALAPSADNYFLAYEDMSIHELMIRDAPRMEAYRKALLANRCTLQQKTHPCAMQQGFNPFVGASVYFMPK
jgi:hypothetical protein